ncbi:DUF4825 domain-containing protein [Sporosarcina beigongshangi]|uniref:DUF4825 domain-containing protein n=1 Tax=Sporosarcina beigongshangi TaxID=2782538 RepID=UPI00193A7D95|nr:DUF4825 domain-containing protein [Sporosarcina beigongshangi]
MKNKIIVGLLAVGLVLFTWMQIVYLPGQERMQEEEELEQLNPETHHFDKVLQYENLYMGNAGNNMNLVNHLPMSDVPRSFRQNPDEFRFTVHYQMTVEGVGKERVEKAVLYNATAIFVLIKNMEIVEFMFVDRTYTVTREHVNNWFGEDIASYKNEEVFMEKVQQPIIEKSQLDEWFSAYTKGEI